MAKNEISVVRLDKKSLYAITNLTKAIKAQNEIVKKNQRPYAVTPGVDPGNIPTHFSIGGYTGQGPALGRLVEGDHIEGLMSESDARHALRQGSN